MKMNKFFAMALPLCAGALLAGCSDAATEEEIAPAPAATIHSFTATILNDDTRAYVDGDDHYIVKWQEGDQMSYFTIGQTENPKVATLVEGYGGKEYGEFTYNDNQSTIGGGCYAIYPYNANDRIERHTIVTELPTEQTYKAGSHGGTNVFMTDYTVATDTNGSLDAIQVYNSYLGLWLKGCGTGFKIIIESKEEPLAGQVKIATPYMDKNGNYVEYPVAVATDQSSKVVTFTCDSELLADEAKPFCVALLPGKYTKLRIKVTNLDGTETYFNRTASNLTFHQGLIKMMDKKAVKALDLPMPEQPNNPGNMNSWGGDDTDIEYTTSDLKKVATADGWTTNVNNYGNGGFATKVTYNHNGIVNNLLTSKGTTAYYFQWGRWLGFPSNCKNLTVYSGGSCTEGINAVSLPGSNDWYDVSTIGYTFNTAVGDRYGACAMGGSSYTRQRALNCSIMFGTVTNIISHGDYIGDNEPCTWSERCGNPCPKGYRIPTANELEVLIPSTGEINGSYAEVKTVDDVKYAMRWKVNTSGSVPCVEICSVKTTANTVSVDDPIFNSAKVIRLPAYGYIDNAGVLRFRGEIGVYWSCDSGKNTISGTTGNGGKYLEIDFYDNNTAIMGIDVALRSFGAPVVPIKDDKAEATPLTPWLPVWSI